MRVTSRLNFEPKLTYGYYAMAAMTYFRHIRTYA
jgi:hypothetical protein